MKFDGKCPKCNGTEIVADAKAVDQGNYRVDMQVSTTQYPNALIFKNERISTVSAYVCLKCGFVEYWADDPKALIEDAF